MRANGQSLGSVTASFGFAMFPDQGSTVESLVGAADAALYKAKHSGRDRVCGPEPARVPEIRVLTSA